MSDTVAAGDLGGVLGLPTRAMVALVGGGGKTTLAFALAQHDRPSTVVTTTTRMGIDQTGGLPVIDLSVGTFPERITAPTLVRARCRERKAVGVDPAWCNDLWSATVCDRIIVEADGSRHRPFKAPADHEPVIPSASTHVLSVIGADALGRVIADNCFRPLRVAAVAGVSPWQRLSPEIAAHVLLSPRAGGRNVPAHALRHVVITKVPDRTAEPEQRRLVDELAAHLHDHIPVTLVQWHPPAVMAGAPQRDR